MRDWSCRHISTATSTGGHATAISLAVEYHTIEPRNCCYCKVMSSISLPPPA